MLSDGSLAVFEFPAVSYCLTSTHELHVYAGQQHGLMMHADQT